MSPIVEWGRHSESRLSGKPEPRNIKQQLKFVGKQVIWYTGSQAHQERSHPISAGFRLAVSASLCLTRQLEYWFLDDRFRIFTAKGQALETKSGTSPGSQAHQVHRKPAFYEVQSWKKRGWKNLKSVNVGGPTPGTTWHKMAPLNPAPNMSIGETFNLRKLPTHFKFNDT